MQKDSYGAYAISDFPRSEHSNRVAKAQEMMRAQGIDCMVITSESNIGYFSGYRGSASVESVDYSPAFLILPKENPPTLVTYVSSRGNVEAMLAVGRPEYVYWDGARVLVNESHPIKILDAVSKAIRESVNLGVLGLELGRGLHVAASLETMDELRKDFPGSKFIDVSQIVWNCRKIKSEREVEYLRKSCEITFGAYERAFSKAREGVTEKEITREVYRGMLDGGGEDMPLKMFLNIRAGPDRYTMCDTRPTDRRLRKGDILILDGGFRYRGYFSDVTRLLCVGNPSEKQRDLFETAREAEVLGLKQMKPGARTGDIWSDIMKYIDERGHLKNSLYEGIGHGIGLDIHEPPRIASNATEFLEAGMVLTMEPCLYDEPVVTGILSGASVELGEGVFFVEDEVVITEIGNEQLASMSRELRVV
jgi:Xaa-Pro dipeptidase